MRAAVVLFATVLAVVIASTSPSHADPITAKEAAEWEALVRNLMGWTDAVDLRKEALGRVRVAQQRLAAVPQSRSQRRDLGDALHTLGHMAEHDHRFDYAISLHIRALENFELSGLETRESWDDGREHAREHIFLDLYDEAVLFERRGDVENAYRYFDTAAFFAYQSGLAYRMRGSERFEPRFIELGRKLSINAKASGRQQIDLGDHAERVFHEVQCKVLFGNPLGL